MTPAAIIEKANLEGVRLSIADQKLKVKGQRSVVEKWQSVLRSNKAEIMAALREIDVDRQARVSSPDDDAQVVDPSSAIAAYHERIAICVAEGASEREAALLAVRECGDLDMLVKRQIDEWRRRLSLLRRPDDPWFFNLCSDCIKSLGTRWLRQAVGHGWTDADLFGLHGHAPKVRIEAMGLVVAVATSGLSRPLSVLAVRTADATIVTAGGHRLTHQRFRINIGEPIWEHHMVRDCTPSGWNDAKG